jgi:sulfatase modifying factor 1
MRFLLIFTSSIATILFCGELRAQSHADEDALRVAVLIKQLGDERFAARQMATSELVAFGERALPAMRNAMSNSRDAEVRYRSEKIIGTILHGCRKSESTGLEMAVIEAGDLQMGSHLKETGRRNDELLHQVRINQPFLLGIKEVTQGQFRRVMEFAPSHFTSEIVGKEDGIKLDTSKFPVERVSWFDAIEFCNCLSKKDGYALYYKMANVHRDGKLIKRADVAIAGGNGYRLPTEAEWEFACRASTNQPFHFGSRASSREANAKPSPVTSYGSRQTKSLGRTAMTGSYKPNALGLYDMHGNVAEWCWDWYAKDYYTNSPLDDPHGPDRGHHRVLRGGSWLVSVSNCRSASRFFLAPDEHKYFAGFRVARTP